MIELGTPLPPDGHGQAFALALLQQTGAAGVAPGALDLSLQIIEAHGSLKLTVGRGNAVGSRHE